MQVLRQMQIRDSTPAGTVCRAAGYTARNFCHHVQSSVIRDSHLMKQHINIALKNISKMSLGKQIQQCTTAADLVIQAIK